MTRLVAVLLGFICFVTGNVSAATMSAGITRGTDYEIVHFFGETIPTSSFLSKTFYGVAGYDALDFYIAAVSSGTTTTVNVKWQQPYQGGVNALTSEVLTSGTPITAFESDVVTIEIYSNVASPVTITGNILFKGR